MKCICYVRCLKGCVPRSYENFGVDIKVVANKDEATCAVKKLGIF